MYKLIDVLTLLNASFYEEVYLKFIKFIPLCFYDREEL